ncbi:AraC family transcriptional regulator [Ferrimonas lipolytica]|uniref:AraC family transcriptional regulator n=2 Tax=Ferrimonas lipolytica TaxID=2724191 RepID=A0A6H1UKD8_9GAMM|nr:AraC family transcriptional regulator [Ferrimonas lipolytica]
MAPGQTIAIEQIEPSDRAFGWTIAFHPDLIRNSEMGRKIEHYNFFHYDTNEALHLSAREVRLVADIAANIELECGNNLDRHSQMLIQSNLELLLKYSERFYDRQFYVRRDLNRGHLNRLNAFLHDYYQSEQCLDKGIPSVALCGKELGLSPYYLSDLLKRETGKNALEHIHLFIIERAKSLLHDGNISITQIAYDLGFEYPQHFSKLFKAKTGLSPRAFKAQS